ncbi:hypothetical protein GCM10027084_28410 [Pseudoxanthomonas sangjuensis]|uniref:hypothetical protein n=1 Tax=Pseudoxanthomonas sangjuensis TaxID=1503750 RepID=UPI0013911A7C|nr:hypothetical protein [Pseudoxanthomonas sangjuensis]KAF1713692.1 hypothetical protein CSC71_06365 [Pseudoxanthomonas sangjuensis]
MATLMKFEKTAFFLFFVAGTASANTCIYKPGVEKYEKATTVFIATITGVDAFPTSTSIGNGDWYRLNYRYLVREVFKGDPSIVESIFTNQIYTTYDAAIVHSMHLSKLQPGDNVLISAGSSGEVNLSGCEGMPWNPDPKELALLRSLNPPDVGNTKP